MAGTVATRDDPGALEVVDASRYPTLSPEAGIDLLREVLVENIGDQGLSLRDLVRVPMPSAGSTTWEIPDRLTGRSEITQELVGLMAFWQAARVYWTPNEDNTLTGEPPDCASPDGKRPIADGLYGPLGASAGLNPGGTCASCPLSRFGTSEKGSRKAPACAERRLLFVARPGELLPLFISAPPTSLDPLKRFMIGLSVTHLMHYSAFQFSLALTKTEKGGNKWATLTPRLVGVLEGARSRVAGGPVEGSPAHRALVFSQGFERLLGDQGALDLATGQARDEGLLADDDGLGGDFADHGEPDGT